MLCCAGAGCTYGEGLAPEHPEMVSGQWHDKHGEGGCWNSCTGCGRNQTCKPGLSAVSGVCRPEPSFGGSAPFVLLAIQMENMSVAETPHCLPYPYRTFSNTITQVCVCGPAFSQMLVIDRGANYCNQISTCHFPAGEQLWSVRTTFPPEPANFNFSFLFLFSFLFYFYFFCVCVCCWKLIFRILYY